MNKVGETSKNIPSKEQTFLFLGAIASQREPVTMQEIFNALPTALAEAIARRQKGFYPYSDLWTDRIVAPYADKGLVDYAPRIKDPKKIVLTDEGKKLHNARRDEARDTMPDSIILGEE
jgi:hypothetical protein